ncbi:MAG: response regulator transcription factor [Candidatus Limiplasma sp.]|nr:response regulator transcription factor [Candidatus Limiplasma sp.]
MTQELSVLVIEDDKYISNFLSVSLKKEGYQAMLAASADEGLFLFSSNHPDVVLLDLGLPDRDGLEVIREIRGFSNTPILVVSARGQEKEKIEALDLGADDYMTKPFHMGELLARIRVVKRKLQQQPAPSSSVFHCDALTVDYEKRKVLVDGNEIHLTPMEYKLLLLMIANKGRVLTHNYIMKEVWGYGETGDTKNIRVFMANLRRKIEKNITKPRFILTEIGVGYRFADE